MAHNQTLNALLQRRGRFQQAENAQVTYTVNWAALLDTDTISSSTWTTLDSGLTIANQANTTTDASARLSGSPGRYRAVNQILTAGGDTFERWVEVTVQDNSSGYTDDYDYWRGYL